MFISTVYALHIQHLAEAEWLSFVFEILGF